MNRTEYGNAVRDLLGVTIDETDLLPSDGGDFGFDNVASALKTSPLMLDRYVAAGLHVAELAVGDASAEPGTATYTISTVVTQDQHVEGLPRWHARRRSGITHVSCGRRIRLLGTPAENGQKPKTGVSRTRDAPSLRRHGRWHARVFSAPIGGKADHDAAERTSRCLAKSSTSA
jgi:hypothetical protein